MKPNRHWTLVAGSLLVLAGNLLTFAGVIWNRSGQADSQPTLTEREISWRTNVNEGHRLTSLYLAPRAEYRSTNSNPDYLSLDSPKQWAALGFHLTDPNQRPHPLWYQQTKSVLVVLEYNGPAYQRTLAQAQKRLTQAQTEARSQGEPALPDQAMDSKIEQAKRHLQEERQQSSRLFIIDAGLDLAALRQRYTDRSRYIIVPGRSWFQSIPENASQRHVLQISIHANPIHVPRQWHDAFFRPWQNPTATAQRPPLQVQLAFGRRLEPWLVKVTARASNGLDGTRP